MNNQEKKSIGFFEKYLTIWVALCIATGILLGNIAESQMNALSKMEIYQVNLPIAILIWLMIYPMMLQIDFTSIRNIRKRPKGIILTVIINWVIKPFTMAFFAWIFFDKLYSAWIDPSLAGEYIAAVSYTHLDVYKRQIQPVVRYSSDSEAVVQMSVDLK